MLNITIDRSYSPLAVSGGGAVDVDGDIDSNDDESNFNDDNSNDDNSNDDKSNDENSNKEVETTQAPYTAPVLDPATIPNTDYYLAKLSKGPLKYLSKPPNFDTSLLRPNSGYTNPFESVVYYYCQSSRHEMRRFDLLPSHGGQANLSKK